MDYIEFERQPDSAFDREAYYRQRLADGKRLLELSLATRTGDFDWSEGVYAEVHGFSEDEAILAVAPHLEYGWLRPGSSEYNHSVFDLIHIAKDEQPEIYDLAHNKLGLGRHSVLYRGVLSKNDDGTLKYGINSQRGIRKDVLERLKGQFDVTTFALNSEFIKTDIELDRFGTNLEVNGLAYDEIVESCPPQDDFEVAVAHISSLEYQDPSMGELRLGNYGKVSVSLWLTRSGHRNHQQLAETIAADYARDGMEYNEADLARLKIYDQLDLQNYVKLRHTLDDVYDDLKIDLLMTPYVESDKKEMNMRGIVTMGSVLLIGYAQSLLLLDEERGSLTARSRSEPKYGPKQTNVVVSVDVPEANVIMQNYIEWETLYELGCVRFDAMHERLSGGWTKVGGASALRDE